MKNYLRTALLGVTALLAVESSGAESVFQTYSFQPEENKAVAGISKLRMTFTNGDMNIDIDRSTVNTITMASSKSTFYCVNLTGFGSIWTMEFAPLVSGTASEIKENGEYTLTIPAGVFHYQSADRINDKITAKFIVSDDIDFDWTCFPANGSSRELPEYGDIDINISFTSATSVSLTLAVQGATYSVRLAGKDLTRVNSLDDGEGYRLSTTSNGLRLQVSKSLVKRTSELSFVAEKGAFTVDGIKSPAIAGAGQWGIYGEDTGGVQAWDTDDSYAGMAGSSVGDSGIMFTGKIDLSEAVAPELSFYVYNFGKSGNEIYPNVLQIQADCGNDFEPVQTINLSDLGDTEGWVKRTVNLSGCKGKTPQLGFVATTKSTNFPYTFIDNVEVKDDDSGVDNVTEGSSAIHVNGHIMTIDNPEREHILVSTVNGVTVYSGDAATVTVDLASGLYVVKTGRTHRKIMVK